MLKHRNGHAKVVLLIAWQVEVWNVNTRKQLTKSFRSNQFTVSTIFSTGSSEDMLINIFQGDQSSHALE